jgi:small conductance mechanosensitive channel
MDISKIYNAAVERLETWLYAIGANLPNLALSVLILIAALFLAKIVRRFSKKYLLKVRTDETISSFLSRLFAFVTVIAGVMLALSILDLTKTVSSILAGLGIVGLALGFAFQDTAANFLSGIYITFNQPYAIGDIVETKDGIMGYVQDINLRVTKIRTFDGPIVYVPNRHLFQENFTNYTEYGKRRLRLECGISYGEDLENVEAVVIEALSSVQGRCDKEDVTVHWQEFGDSSINFIANIWLEYSNNNQAYIGVKNEAIKKLKSAFDANDIMIPFPIRTLDFGIKGGVTLDKSLQNAPLKAVVSSGAKVELKDADQKKPV